MVYQIVSYSTILHDLDVSKCIYNMCIYVLYMYMSPYTCPFSSLIVCPI